MDTYRYLNPVGCGYLTECVELDNGEVMELVVGSGVVTVEAFTINYGQSNFGNKYFTVELFNQYLQSICCGCSNDPCFDTCFILLNSSCKALVNGEGLLI